jgi:hypothetical protein
MPKKQKTKKKKERKKGRKKGKRGRTHDQRWNKPS